MRWIHNAVATFERWMSEDCSILHSLKAGAPYRLIAFVDEPPGPRWTECDGGFFRDFGSLAEAKKAAAVFGE